MEVRRFDDPASFAARVEPLLMRDEARHNLFLGILGTLRNQPAEHPEFFLWSVEADGAVVGAGAQTPPHNLVVAKPLHEDALPALASALLGDGVRPPGVTAARPEVDRFAAAWTAVGGGTSSLRMGLGLYRLSEVRPVTGVPGRMRPAVAGDRGLLIPWLYAFQREATAEGNPTDFDRWLDLRLKGGSGGVFIWEDPAPVAMSGYGRATPNGARIGPVYTPPELRGRGYASALVADTSRWLLSEGRRFCFLFTDLANPTSNRIYQRIGYDLVCESADVGFDPPDAVAPSDPP